MPAVFLNRLDRSFEVWLGGLEQERLAQLMNDYETIRHDEEAKAVVADMTVRWLELCLQFAVRTLEEPIHHSE